MLRPNINLNTKYQHLSKNHNLLANLQNNNPNPKLLIKLAQNLTIFTQEELIIIIGAVNANKFNDFETLKMLVNGLTRVIISNPQAQNELLTAIDNNKFNNVRVKDEEIFKSLILILHSINDFNNNPIFQAKVGLLVQHQKFGKTLEIRKALISLLATYDINSVHLQTRIVVLIKNLSMGHDNEILLGLLKILNKANSIQDLYVVTVIIKIIKSNAIPDDPILLKEVAKILVKITFTKDSVDKLAKFIEYNKFGSNIEVWTILIPLLKQMEFINSELQSTINKFINGEIRTEIIIKQALLNNLPNLINYKNQVEIAKIINEFSEDLLLTQEIISSLSKINFTDQVAQIEIVRMLADTCPEQLRLIIGNWLIGDDTYEQIQRIINFGEFEKDPMRNHIQFGPFGEIESEIKPIGNIIINNCFPDSSAGSYGIIYQKDSHPKFLVVYNKVKTLTSDTISIKKEYEGYFYSKPVNNSEHIAEN